MKHIRKRRTKNIGNSMNDSMKVANTQSNTLAESDRKEFEKYKWIQKYKAMKEREADVQIINYFESKDWKIKDQKDLNDIVFERNEFKFRAIVKEVSTQDIIISENKVKEYKNWEDIHHRSVIFFIKISKRNSNSEWKQVTLDNLLKTNGKKSDKIIVKNSDLTKFKSKYVK